MKVYLVFDHHFGYDVQFDRAFSTLEKAKEYVGDTDSYIREVEVDKNEAE